MEFDANRIRNLLKLYAEDYNWNILTTEEYISYTKELFELSDNRAFLQGVRLLALDYNTAKLQLERERQFSNNLMHDK